MCSDSFAVVHTIRSGESCAASASIHQLIARLTKAVIPLPDKSANKIAEVFCYKWRRTGDVRPGVHACPAVGKSFKRYPLLHRIAKHVVDPGNLPRRRANGDHVINRDFFGADDFDLKPASCGPGFAFAPADVSIDIGKAGPKAVVAKHLPGKRGACLGKDCVLQILHLFLATSYWIRRRDGNQGLDGQGTTQEEQLAHSSRRPAGTDEGTPAVGQNPTTGKLTVNST